MTEFLSSLDLVAAARTGYALAAAAHLLFGIYLTLAWSGGRAGAVLLCAIVAGGAWSLATYFALATDHSALALVARLLDSIRLGTWYAFLMVVMAGVGMSRRLVVQLSLASGVIVLALAVFVISGAAPQVGAQLDQQGLMTSSLLAAVFGLVLVEQLFRNLPPDSRWGVKPLSLGLAAAFAFDLYLYAEGLLFQRVDVAVWSVRGFVFVLVLPLIALSVARNPGWKIGISVSRQVVFHTSALLISGVYLLLVAGAGYYVRIFGGDWGRAFQVALVFAGLLGLFVLGVSGSLRAGLRVWLSKNLFAYRYDYRNEWLGFTQALSEGSSQRSPGEAVVEALADLVESPGGGVWLQDASGEYRLQGRLNMPDSDAVEPVDGVLATFLRQRGWIVNLEEFRTRRALYDGLSLPEWLSRLEHAWLVIPLGGGSDLTGFVVLLSPRTPFEVDWEVLDLLKTAQQQAASFLAQLRAQEALLEAQKFDAFNRMSAFVVHDLKNLVAQLSLLLRNAERHKHNPEFQEDMLATIAHVESRMRGLMSQLLEKTSFEPKRPVELAAIVGRVVDARSRQTPRPELLESESVMVLAHADRLERILGHIVQNAMDATAEDGKVTVRIRREGPGRGLVVVSDSGCGMSQEFVRDGLFRPFKSTKSSGMGIGAYEARQYVRELGGNIEVDSEPGTGTVVSVKLPVCEAAAPVSE